MKRRRLLIGSLAFLLLAGGILYLWREKEQEKKFIPEIKAAAGRYGVDPLLVKAIVWRESRFDPNVRGRSGEIGLMQLRELAAQEWADEEKIGGFDHEHCVDPATNTLAGTYYLSRLLKRYSRTDNSMAYALADYNAGRGNLVKWNNGSAATNSAVFIEQIGFPGTREYVKAVMRRYTLYQFLSRFGW
jgi:soluble lytic murein transglycosylase